VVGLGEPVDDVGEHPAALVLGLGLVVVEELADAERLGQLFLGALEGLGEAAGGLVAELGDGEAELLLAGADGVVGLDQEPVGLAVEVLGGALVDGCAALARGGGGGLAAAAHPDDGADDERGDDEEAQDDADDVGARGRGPGDAVAVGGGLVPGGGVDGGLRPVLVFELRGDEGGGDLVELGVRERERRVDRPGVAAVAGGDGEEEVVGAEPGVDGAGVGPGLRGVGVEAVDVGDVEADAGGGGEVVDGVLDVAGAVAERADLVGDRAREGDRGGGGRGGRGSEEDGGGQRRGGQGRSRAASHAGHRGPHPRSVGNEVSLGARRRRSGAFGELLGSRMDPAGPVTPVTAEIFGGARASYRSLALNTREC